MWKIAHIFRLLIQSVCLHCCIDGMEYKSGRRNLNWIERQRSIMLSSAASMWFTCSTLRFRFIQLIFTNVSHEYKTPLRPRLRDLTAIHRQWNYYKIVFLIRLHIFVNLFAYDLIFTKIVGMISIVFTFYVTAKILKLRYLRLGLIS